MRTEIVRAMVKETGEELTREVNFPETWEEIIEACGGDGDLAVRVFNRGWRLYHQADMKSGGKAKLRELARKLAELPPEKVEAIFKKLGVA